VIVEENQGFHKMLKFLCADNVRQMNQCSLFLTQLWRGNTDVKYLIYDSGPRQPSPRVFIYFKVF
jgi:hypothetical protein